jgi:hypothetical protein
MGFSLSKVGKKTQHNPSTLVKEEYGSKQGSFFTSIFISAELCTRFGLDSGVTQLADEHFWG